MSGLPYKKFLVLTGALLLLFVSSLYVYWVMCAKGKEYPLEDVLYVTNWEITKIHGPGTAEQAAIVKKFGELGIKTYNTTLLYRMGGKNTMDGNEGVILTPYDPHSPKDALKLKSSFGDPFKADDEL